MFTEFLGFVNIFLEHIGMQSFSSPLSPHKWELKQLLRDVKTEVTSQKKLRTTLYDDKHKLCDFQEKLHDFSRRKIRLHAKN